MPSSVVCLEVLTAFNCCTQPTEEHCDNVQLASLSARLKVSGTPDLRQCHHHLLSLSIPALTTVKVKMKMRMKDMMRMKRLKGIGKTSNLPFPLESYLKERQSSMESTGTECVALTVSGSLHPFKSFCRRLGKLCVKDSVL